MDKVERPEVVFVVNRDPVQALFERIVDALVPLQRFFRHRGRLVCCTPSGLRPITVRSLPGQLVGCLELLFVRATPDGEQRLGYRVLSADLARALLVSPALDRLPELVDSVEPVNPAAPTSPSQARERQLEQLGPLAAQFAGSGPAPATVWVERLEAAGLQRLVTSPLGERSPRGKATRLGRLFGAMLGVPFGSGEHRYELVRHYPRGPQGKPLYEIIVSRRPLDGV